MVMIVSTGALRRFTTWAVMGAASAWLVAAGSVAFAAPPAGTPIGNQASATYLDASSTPRTATSNLVTTIVQQVASFTLTADGSRTASPGGQAAFPHTLTNTGNGTDNFDLGLANLVGDDFDLTGLAVYADADGNGVPDDFTPLAATGSLAAGAAFHFVVVGSVPGTQIGGQLARARITATSQFDNAQTAFNTDLVTVTGNAVISVTKSISQAAGASPSGPYTYTLSYTNSGNATATALRLVDAIPAGMTYVTSSGRWSTTGAAVLTDLDNTDPQGVAPNTIVYDFGVSTGGSVTAVIAGVPPGASGTLTFEVDVDAGLPPGAINNTATYSYNDGAANVGPFTTNTVPFAVNQVASLAFTGQTIASAPQGATLVLTNVLTNTGNGTDVFDITLGGSTFPAGTSYVLYQADGATPLTDTNGNGVPDTGPLAAGASTNIVLNATLPPAATGGPYQVQKTARSSANPAVSAVATDQLTSITPNAVDLTNDAAGDAAPGAGPGPELSPVITNTTNPATTTRFTLYVNNNSGVSDVFDLAASTDPAFGSLTLPAGWTVTFRDVGNVVVTSTGTIGAGSDKLIYADVTVPAGTAAGLQDLYFRALSPVSGASDRIHDAVDVSAVRALTVVPNNSAQAVPGGVVTYTHLLANNGNVTEGDGVGSFVTFAVSNDQVGWLATLFVDTNDNGVYDGTDAPIADLGSIGGLAPGGSIRLFARVAIPAGAPLGQVNTSTLTVTTINNGYSTAVPPPATATDQTTVLNGQVQIVKRQALDTDCDGTPEAAYTTTNITTGAIPGACLRYEITVTNVGTASVSGVVVSDATPANTTYSDAIPASTTVGTISTPGDGLAGTITANVGILGPGQSAVVILGVRINP